jgi:hypothetical protein
MVHLEGVGDVFQLDGVSRRSASRHDGGANAALRNQPDASRRPADLRIGAACLRFAQLWRRFAHDFTDGAHSDEYNSIKHGLRVRSGGFHFAVAMEDNPGEPAPADRWKSLGGSDFGSTFYRFEPLLGEPNKHNIRGKASMHNWNPENYLNGLSLLSVSLQNVLSFALARNGVTEKLEYFYPSEDHAWESPWAKNIGVTSMTMIEYVLWRSDNARLSRSDPREV